MKEEKLLKSSPLERLAKSALKSGYVGMIGLKRHIS